MSLVSGFNLSSWVCSYPIHIFVFFISLEYLHFLIFSNITSLFKYSLFFSYETALGYMYLILSLSSISFKIYSHLPFSWFCMWYILCHFFFFYIIWINSPKNPMKSLSSFYREGTERLNTYLIVHSFTHWFKMPPLS